MKKPVKILITWLFMSLLALLGGQLLGSYFFKSIGNDGIPVGLTTLYQLSQLANGMMLQSMQFRFALIISFLPFLLVTVLLLIAAIKKPKRELHGSAKFAKSVDIQNAKLLDTKYKEPDILI